jgi:hypothetical protein
MFGIEPPVPGWLTRHGLRSGRHLLMLAVALCCSLLPKMDEAVAPVVIAPRSS